jgi:hypothetical protein
MHGFRLSFFYAGLMLLSQLHRRCLAINHGCSLCTKEEQRCLPVFVVGSCIRARNPSKTFSTIREQRQNMGLKRPPSPSRKKFQELTICRNADAYSILGPKGPVPKHYQERSSLQ